MVIENKNEMIRELVIKYDKHLDIISNYAWNFLI